MANEAMGTLVKHLSTLCAKERKESLRIALKLAGVEPKAKPSNVVAFLRAKDRGLPPAA